MLERFKCSNAIEICNGIISMYVVQSGGSVRMDTKINFQMAKGGGWGGEGKNSQCPTITYVSPFHRYSEYSF